MLPICSLFAMQMKIRPRHAQCKQSDYNVLVPSERAVCEFDGVDVGVMARTNFCLDL